MARWEKQFGESALIRGEKYAYSGKVQDVSWDNDFEHFYATISGSGHAVYDVSGCYKDDGRVSELSCDCPWAKKGHLCKHMAAVLYAIDDGQVGIPRSQEEKTLMSQLHNDFKDQVKTSDSKVDPLKIVVNQKFPNSAYQEAQIYQKDSRVVEHYFDKLTSTNYAFSVKFKKGVDSFSARIVFNKDEIVSIDVKTQYYSGLNEDAIKIMAIIAFLHYFSTENPMDGTNRAAHQLLDTFLNSPDQEKSDSNSTEPLELHAILEEGYYDYREKIRFKFGAGTHLYIVKNFSDLLDYFDSGNKLYLGKFFDRVVNFEDLTDEGKIWYNFISDIAETKKIIDNDGYSYHGYGQLNEIILTPVMTDRIAQLVEKGAPLYIKNKRLKFSTKDAHISTKLETNKNDKTLTLEFTDFLTEAERLDLLEGKESYYVVSENSWTKITGVTPSFVNRSKIQFDVPLEFGKENTTIFGQKILPKLLNENSVQLDGVQDLEEILPPSAQFIFRLDYQDQSIKLRPSVKYGAQSYQLLQKIKDNTVRDFAQEQKVVDLINKYDFDVEKDAYLLRMEDSDLVDNFLDDGMEEFEEAGQIEATASFKRLISGMKNQLRLSVGVSLGDESLDIEVAGEKLSPEDIEAILDAYNEKRHYFVLHNGQLRKVDSPSVEELAGIMKSLNVSLSDFVKGKMAVPAYRAFYLDSELKTRNNLEYTSDDAFKKLINDLEDGAVEKTPIPEELQATLRPYQVQGFQWLNTLANYNLNGLLADEMGLGKTIQVISVLLARKNKSKLPSLIIAPASVVYNWTNEFKKFAPSLKVLTLGGSKAERAEQFKQADQADVLITSYSSLKRDLTNYNKLKFDFEVIDEAQNIKTATAETTKAVKVINATHRIALTGTPIENNLSELWSIFDYLMPGFLGDHSYFKENYEKPIVKEQDEETEKRLGKIIAPFVLRRLKKNVMQALPDKSEDIVYADLSGKQSQLYNAQAQKLILELSGQDEQEFKKNRFQVLAGITKLRELCCDPNLLYENYRGKSAKLTETLNLIQNSVADGHKILLFSQFTSMLDILQSHIEKLGIKTFVITGSVPKQMRQDLVEEFNKLEEPAVFLISLKAGGTGINLTSADVVIHYDPWWNIAAENQATDRAHRIGQKNSVQVYKIVAKDTIEEKIIKLQQKKAELAEAVLSGKNIGSSSLNKDELLDILQR